MTRPGDLALQAVARATFCVTTSRVEPGLLTIEASNPLFEI